MSTNLERVRQYLQAIEGGATGEALAAFFHPEAVQREFPNRLVASGATRDVKALGEAAERGQRVISAQRYEVLHALAEGEHVALEVQWSGTLKVALGSLPVGATMRARCAMFLQLREGRILSQHNYDCFEPF
jgi:ketosteroid isomerase-like protein